MKTKIISVILLCSMGFIACKKESVSNPKSTQEKLLGKWNLVSTVTNEFYNGSPHLNTQTFQAGDYIDFRNDGKIYGYNSGSYDTTSYGILNDSRVWIADASNVYEIKILTDADLQLYIKEVFSSSEYSEATLTAKK